MNTYEGANAAPVRATHSTRSRQAARIIKHLRQELAHEHPLLTLPTGWMIDCLVCNCPPELLSGRDWKNVVAQLLRYIIAQADPDLNTLIHFHQQDPLVPLFPNDELFDDYDVHHFCSALLEQIEKEA